MASDQKADVARKSRPSEHSARRPHRKGQRIMISLQSTEGTSYTTSWDTTRAEGFDTALCRHSIHAFELLSGSFMLQKCKSRANTNTFHAAHS